MEKATVPKSIITTADLRARFVVAAMGHPIVKMVSLVGGVCIKEKPVTWLSAPLAKVLHHKVDIAQLGGPLHTTVVRPFETVIFPGKLTVTMTF